MFLTFRRQVIGEGPSVGSLRKSSPKSLDQRSNRVSPSTHLKKETASVSETLFSSQLYFRKMYKVDGPSDSECYTTPSEFFIYTKNALCICAPNQKTEYLNLLETKSIKWQRSKIRWSITIACWVGNRPKRTPKCARDQVPSRPFFTAGGPELTLL
jgi:hypothetical protein